MSKPDANTPPQGENVIYHAEDGNTRIEVRFVDETVWLTQQQMAELFQTSRTNIVEHIRNIYSEGELEKSATCRKFRQVRDEGGRQVSRDLPHYNLDMDKAVAEYRRFQLKELSPVERSYLESIQTVSRIVKRKAHAGKSRFRR